MYTKTNTKLYATDYKCFKSNGQLPCFWLSNLYKTYFLWDFLSVIIYRYDYCYQQQLHSLDSLLVLWFLNSKTSQGMMNDSTSRPSQAATSGKFTKLSRATMHSDIYYQLKGPHSPKMYCAPRNSFHIWKPPHFIWAGVEWESNKRSRMFFPSSTSRRGNPHEPLEFV